MEFKYTDGTPDSTKNMPDTQAEFIEAMLRMKEVACKYKIPFEIYYTVGKKNGCAFNFNESKADFAQLKYCYNYYSRKSGTPTRIFLLPENEIDKVDAELGLL